MPLAEWTFQISGAVDRPVSWTWDAFLALPAVTPTVDIHCVTAWSKLDTHWTGVSVDTILAGLGTEAEYVRAWCDDGYRTNLPLYPAVQAYFRKYKPPTLIVWGKNDFIFPADGAYPYKRDLPEVEFHLIDTGHFALEDKFDEMVPLIRDFLKRKVA